MPSDKSKNYSVTNEKTKVSEPVMVNRHSESDRWEWDPNYIDPIYVIQEAQDVKDGQEEAND